MTEALNVLDTWLYGGDPAQALLAEGTLSLLARKLEGAYFPDLLRSLFLEENHCVTVVLTPSRSLGGERAAREAARIASESAAWTGERREELRREAESLAAWQQTPDSPEALATIPVLQLIDLDEEPAPLPMTVGKMGETTVLRHGTDSKLVAFKTFFNFSDLRLEELPKLVALSSLLGVMGTKRRSGEELQMLVKEHIGKLSIQPGVVAGSDPEHCRVLLTASVVCLPEQAEAAAALLREILTETDFSDRTLLREQLQQSAMGAQMSLASGGHLYAMTRVSACGTAHGAAREQISGTELCLWLKKWSAAGEAELDGLLEDLAALAQRGLRTERLTLSCTENTPEPVLEGLRGAFPTGGAPTPEEARYVPLGIRREGIAIPAQVGYAARGGGGSLKHCGMAYSGSLPVLANVLNYVYLWNEIRVRGGAYGCGFVSRDDGDLGFYTYRDPQPGRSLGVMDGSADFLRGFCAENPDLTGYILGAVSGLNPLLTEEKRRALAESRYFKGISDEDVCRWYHQLVHTTPADLLALSGMLEQLRSGQSACVVAGSALLDACGGQLDSRLTIA